MKAPVRSGGGRWIRTTEGISRQIYSLLPLATRAFLQIFVEAKVCWSWRWDSNPRPPDYKSGALPVELRQQDCSGKAGWRPARIDDPPGLVKYRREGSPGSPCLPTFLL